MNKENKIRSDWAFNSQIVWIRELAEMIEKIVSTAPSIIIEGMGEYTLYQYFFVICDMQKKNLLSLKPSKDLNDMMNTIFSNKNLRDAGEDEYYSNYYDLNKIAVRKYLESELESLRIKHENKNFKIENRGLLDQINKLKGKIEGYERALDNKQEKEIKKIDNMAQSYITSCEKFLTEKPTLKMLNEISTISKDIWKKQLSNSKFLFVLLKELEKKKNLAHRDKTEFWIGAYSYIEKKIANALQDQKVKKQSYNDDFEYNRETGKKKKTNSDYD